MLAIRVANLGCVRSRGCRPIFFVCVYRRNLSNSFFFLRNIHSLIGDLRSRVASRGKPESLRNTTPGKRKGRPPIFPILKHIYQCQYPPSGRLQLLITLVSGDRMPCGLCRHVQHGHIGKTSSHRHTKSINKIINT